MSPLTEEQLYHLSITIEANRAHESEEKERGDIFVRNPLFGSTSLTKYLESEKIYGI